MTLLFLPPPLPDLIIFPVLIILSLSFLTVGFGGATYSSAIGGMLLSVTEASFVPFTIFLAILFGLTIDIFSSIFKAKINPEGLRKFRLALALVASSTSYRTDSFLRDSNCKNRAVSVFHRRSNYCRRNSQWLYCWLCCCEDME